MRTYIRTWVGRKVVQGISTYSVLVLLSIDVASLPRLASPCVCTDTGLAGLTMYLARSMDGCSNALPGYMQRLNFETFAERELRMASQAVNIAAVQHLWQYSNQRHRLAAAGSHLCLAAIDHT